MKKIKLPFELKKTVLGLGSQTKNTVCLLKGEFAYLSSPHQDLNNPQDFLSFKKAVKLFLGNKPKVVAYDLHPEYQSTKYALSLPSAYRLMPIQHHHAHIAACMLENGLSNQKVIGVAFDGTGLGKDNKLRGAEFLICDYKNFSRLVSLKEIPLLGGERAILEPWRVLAAWTGRASDKRKWRVLKKMYSAGVNAPLSSSMGRLFDAVASLVLNKSKARFEAELAMELERLATRAQRHQDSAQRSVASPKGTKTSGRKDNGYKFRIIKKGGEYILDPSIIFKQIAHDLEKGIAKEKIAYQFHLTVAKMIEKTCLFLRKKSKINHIVLSGGVFQNKLLSVLAMNLLTKGGFKVFTHQQLSCNDSNISLGQAVIANFN